MLGGKKNQGATGGRKSGFILSAVIERGYKEATGMEGGE